MLLTVALLFNLVVVLNTMSAEAVSQAELDALKLQQEELDEQRADIQSQADELSDEMDSQTTQIAVLNAKLEVTNAQLDNLTEQILLYTNSIAELENELNLNTQKEHELMERLKIRIRVMEESGSVSYISILFGANSFEDLLDRINCINEIMEYDNGLIDDVREATETVQAAKADMEAEMAEQESVFAAYEEIKLDLAAQEEEAAAVLESLAVDAEEYETQLATVHALQASLSEEISDMEDALAEQERIRAEQEAAAKAAAQGNNDSWYGDGAGTATGQEIVDYCMTFLGVDYVYGGTSPSGFDCSGLVYYCYRHFGYSINRTATAQSYNGVSVSSQELEPGDLIFFGSVSGGYITHVGMYVGNGQFIHAPHTGDVVKISSLSSNYYTSHYYCARRIVSG